MIRHGYVDGLTADELRAHAAQYWHALLKMQGEWHGVFDSRRRAGQAKGFHVLARAMRARRPGIVFAHAAATGEVDPLTDPDSRLFVGLPI